MDRTKMVSDAIKEHNIRGEKINWKKLVELFKGRISGSTISNIINKLIKSGILRVESPTDSRTPLKYLYMNEYHMEERNDSADAEIDEASKIEADLQINISISISGNHNRIQIDYRR
ncbi:MAG: MarR family transcriptional regulator [Methanomassiliicoccaceae archaeon]|nr:MarR family transcriptional regulator [Methanomassiliicoccaceae archaeon]